MPDTCTTLASERGSGSGGPSLHLSKLPIPDSWATNTVVLRRLAIGPADVQDLGPELRGGTIRSRARAGQIGRRLVPRRDRPDRRRARQALVRGRAEIDRGPCEDAQLHGPVDRQVVGAVGDVPEQQDDDDQPDEGLDPGPRPAVRVEQAEQGPLARHDHPGSERPLRHRPPILTHRSVDPIDGRSLRGQRSCHVGVHRADERVGPRRQRRHRVVAFRGAGEHVGLENDGPRRILDLDVVRDAGVLIVERQRERGIGRSRQLGRVERD